MLAWYRAVCAKVCYGFPPVMLTADGHRCRSKIIWSKVKNASQINKYTGYGSTKTILCLHQYDKAYIQDYAQSISKILVIHGASWTTFRKHAPLLPRYVRMYITSWHTWCHSRPRDMRLGCWCLSNRRHLHQHDVISINADSPTRQLQERASPRAW